MKTDVVTLDHLLRMTPKTERPSLRGEVFRGAYLVHPDDPTFYLGKDGRWHGFAGEECWWDTVYAAEEFLNKLRDEKGKPHPWTLEDLKKLPRACLNNIHYCFNMAATYRARQWGMEREIEKILGCEINVDFADWAGAVDDPAMPPNWFDEEEILETLAENQSK